MSKLTTLIVMFLALAGGAAIGTASDHGGERPAPYMRMGFGGRQTAMGGAGTALTGGLASGFWNPANLTGVRTFQFYTQYSFLTMDRTLAYLSLGNRLERSPLSYSISWAYFSAGDELEFRYGPSYDPVYNFSDSEMAFFITTAYRISSRVSVGTNVKVHTHWLGEFFGWGMGEDAGVLVRVSRETKLGLSIQDPLSAVKFQNTDSGGIPMALKTGVSHTFFDPYLTVSGDLVYSADLGLEPAGGIEWMPGYGIGLRAGWGTKSFRCGFGIIARGSRLVEEFNYTLIQDTLQEGSVLHRVSVGMRFR